MWFGVRLLAHPGLISEWQCQASWRFLEKVGVERAWISVFEWENSLQ